ncbi:DUF4430 domain-containing protein [Oxobacter pfennigii]|nr:DUF4430 domain-containing protein [Oxobacter pfennigii]
MLKKRMLILICLILIVSLTACGRKQGTRVITNNENVKVETESSENNKLEENVDTSIYKDYKGPVQGEIKYQEGRPASQNSQELKASGDIESPYQIDLIVTRDFGYNKMFSKNVGLVKDEVGMEVLFRNLDIQTAYGGGFVNSINGLESKYTFFSGADRSKEDWFYWVNGILAPIGVAEYRPAPGDVIWWDYHEWNTTMFIPAVIGSYPQPFKNGFGGKNPGTVIMYTENFREEGEKLKESLISQGVVSVDILPYNADKVEKPEKYTIIIGSFDDISKDSKRLQDMNWKNKMEGVYVEFEEGKLNALDNTGKVIKSFSKAGAIYATAAGMGSVVPVWLVTGNDEDSIKKAAEVLIEKPESIKNYFQAVIAGDEIIQIPYIQ